MAALQIPTPKSENAFDHDVQIAFASNITVGSTIVVFLSLRNGFTYVGISDTRGLTWTLRSGPVASNGGDGATARIYTAKVGAGQG
nr:hypothetical protein [Gemmatimonadaceae bacterium]